jgi:negative regulator of replication initiation
MSDETQRLKKIAKAIKKSTSLKNEDKIQEVSKAVDKFAQFILQCYLEEKCEVKK